MKQGLLGLVTVREVSFILALQGLQIDVALRKVITLVAHHQMPFSGSGIIKLTMLT